MCGFPSQFSSKLRNKIYTASLKLIMKYKKKNSHLPFHLCPMNYWSLINLIWLKVLAFYPVTFYLGEVLSCNILSKWCSILYYFVLLDFSEWHLFLCIFCASCLFTCDNFFDDCLPCGIFFAWHFVLRHFLEVAFYPVAICQNGVLSEWHYINVTFCPSYVLSCDILSELRFVL